MFKMAFLWELIHVCEYEIKKILYRSSLELFPFVILLTQVAGLIEDHLEIGPTYFHKSLPIIPT